MSTLWPLPSRINLFVVAVVLLVTSGCGATVLTPIVEVPTDAGVPTLPAGTESAHVTRVIDGDTIEVSIGSTSYRVRYIGINTPETSQPCGDTATDANTALVGDQDVTLVKDISETDRYGRLLRYVYVGDLFINAELARQGFAEAATYPPDVAHTEEFVELAAQARETNLGCWASDVWSSVDPPASPTAVIAEPSATAASSESAAFCECNGGDLDCSSFRTHAEAQACFDYCMAAGFGDTFRLDGDSDNIACESLP